MCACAFLFDMIWVVLCARLVCACMFELTVVVVVHACLYLSFLFDLCYVMFGVWL